MAYRVDNKTAVSALPPINTSNVGEPGFFTGGDPATGLGATDVDADWLNRIQEEQLSVVEGAGLTPDKTNNGQMLQAIKKLIPAPINTSGFLTSSSLSGYATTTALDSAVQTEQQRAERAEANLLPLSGGTLTGNITGSAGGIVPQILGLSGRIVVQCFYVSISQPWVSQIFFPIPFATTNNLHIQVTSVSVNGMDRGQENSEPYISAPFSNDRPATSSYFYINNSSPGRVDGHYIMAIGIM